MYKSHSDATVTDPHALGWAAGSSGPRSIASSAAIAAAPASLSCAVPCAADSFQFAVCLAS